MSRAVHKPGHVGREPLPEARPPKGHARCRVCGTPFELRTGKRGRPRETCSAECRDLDSRLNQIERAIEAVANRATVAKRSALRARFWRLANQIRVNEGKSNDYFRKRRKKG